MAHHPGLSQDLAQPRTMDKRPSLNCTEGVQQRHHVAIPGVAQPGPFPEVRYRLTQIKQASKYLNLLHEKDTFKWERLDVLEILICGKLKCKWKNKKSCNSFVMVKKDYTDFTSSSSNIKCYQLLDTPNIH